MKINSKIINLETANIVNEINNNSITLSELSRKLKKARSTIYPTVDRLQKYGLITYHSNNKKTSKKYLQLNNKSVLKQKFLELHKLYN